MKYFVFFLILIIAGCAKISSNLETRTANPKSFNYNLNTNFVRLAASSKPSKGIYVTDPDFSTTFERISDATSDAAGLNMAALIYSRYSPLNSCQQYLLLQRTAGSPDALLYSAQDHSFIKIFPSRITLDGVADQLFLSMEAHELRWDYSGNRPSIIYYVNDTRFCEYDVVNNTGHMIHDFKNDFSNAAYIMNEVEGDSSADSRYWAWEVKDSSYNMIAIITYDKQNNAILGTLTYSNYLTLGGKGITLPRPNMVEISPSGKKIIYHLGRCYSGNRLEDAGTLFDGPHAWDLNFTNPVKVSADETHSGWGWDYNGNEMFVSQNNRNDWIEAVNIITGATNQMLYHGNLGWNNGFHFARMPSSCRGWILMSTYCDGTNTDWGDNQLLMLEIKDKSSTPAPRVWRLGHTHNNHDEYYAEGFAAMSQYGDKIWWNAKWPGQTKIETYEMQLPVSWLQDLAK